MPGEHVVMAAGVISSKLDLIARRLEGDIRSRGLRHGDRYLTVAEAATTLGVSPATAHRAMDLLVARKMLTRHHGRGTFVGEAAAPPTTQISTVYIMLPDDQAGVSGLHLEEFVRAIRLKLPAVNVQFTFVPANAGLDYARGVLDLAQETDQLAGVIAISCPRDVYHHLAELRVPTIVLGSLYGDQDKLASIDIDYRRVGRLLADYLVRRGHARMVMFTTSDGRPGDHAFVDGVSDALTAADLPHNAMKIRIFPRDFDAFSAQVEDVLAPIDRPTGVICSTEQLLGAVTSVAQRIGLDLTKDLELVYHGQSDEAGAATAVYTHTQPSQPFREIAVQVVEMLATLTRNEPLSEDRVVIGAQLHEKRDK